jgi:hypothetical protein
MYTYTTHHASTQYYYSYYDHYYYYYYTCIFFEKRLHQYITFCSSPDIITSENKIKYI